MALLAATLLSFMPCTGYSGSPHNATMQRILLVILYSLIFLNQVCSYFLHSNIHSLSENKSSAEGVYSVFVALQENPSLQKLEWVQPFLSFLLVKIFLLNFICCCILTWMVVWIPDWGSQSSNKMVACIPDSLSWLYNKSSGTNNWMCISNMMCLTTRNHGFNFPSHTVV